MTPDHDEAALIEARRLRDVARGIVLRDIATLRHSLSERPITRRMRDGASEAVTQTAHGAAAIARENRVLLTLTATAAIGWLFRRGLGSAAQAGWTWLGQKVRKGPLHKETTP